MPLTHLIKRATVDYRPDGSVANVHIEGETPRYYADQSAAAPEPFGFDTDSGTFGDALHLVAPNLDSYAVAVAQYQTLAQLAADHLATPP